MKDKKKMIKKKIEENEDYIYAPRLGNSIKKMLDKHPDGIDDQLIEKVLLISPEELKAQYDSAIKKLKELLEN